MLEPTHNSELPPIPTKRYFTIGEVSDLCAVKATRLALLGARVSATKAREAPWKPKILPACRCRNDSHHT